MYAATRKLDWLPPDSSAECSIQLRAAGQDWDAVRVPSYIGRHAVTVLGQDSGAVIHDLWGKCLYRLVPVGTAATWDVPQTRPCGQAQYVAIPARTRVAPPGLHWIMPLSGERCLTDPQLLRGALYEAVDAILGPRNPS